jgi:hypothetical protein
MDNQDLAEPQRELRRGWDRPSARNEAEREERYQQYLETSAPYFAEVEAAGDKPWFSTDDERRELFYRRHIRPEPPAGIPVRTLAEIRGT